MREPARSGCISLKAEESRIAGYNASVPDDAPITQLLRAWSDGDETALDALVPLIESELRHMARVYMARERRDHTLQASALVNEAFVRLVDAQGIRWQDRAHFLSIAARLMRRVLVDHARARGFQKRGAGRANASLDEAVLISRTPDVDVLDLDRALEALARLDERKARVIDMRFFAGMTVQETADALQVSADTVKRDWQFAKLWLLRHVEGHRQ
jgi:RNA polymerase sigma factor (TIGR02999 family)